MKYWLLLIVGLCLGDMVVGQTFRASVLAGGNLSQIDGDDLLGFHQPGVNVGLRVVALLGDRWRVGPELLYSQLGAKRNRNSFNISDYRQFRLQTAEIPLMVYYKDWRLTAEAGVSYQRLINYTVDDSRGDDITDTTPLDQDALAIKLGATLYVTPRWGVNFRWSKQLTDLQGGELDRLRTRWLTLRVVYTLGSGEAMPNATTE